MQFVEPLSSFLSAIRISPSIMWFAIAMIDSAVLLLTAVSFGTRGQAHGRSPAPFGVLGVAFGGKSDRARSMMKRARNGM